MKPVLTPFEEAVLGEIEAGINQMADSWEIAYNLRRDLWDTKRAGRPGWVTAVGRAGRKLVELGLVVCLPGEGGKRQPTWCRVRHTGQKKTV